MNTARALAAALAAGLVISAVAAPAAPDLATLQQMTARFAPVPLSADLSSLPAPRAAALLPHQQGAVVAARPRRASRPFITLRDDAETAKLARFSGVLQELEDHLPIDPGHRNPKLGALAPIRVVNVVFTAGDANSGVQTAAFNLPNDERVVKEKGAKRVMLRNVQQAKFEKVLQPIAAVALPPGDRAHVSFEAFFTHILMHELMHGLGPHSITVGGRATTVRGELRENYMSGVPVDIEPRFVTADELAGRQSPLSSRKPVTTRQ